MTARKNQADENARIAATDEEATTLMAQVEVAVRAATIVGVSTTELRDAEDVGGGMVVTNHRSIEKGGLRRGVTAKINARTGLMDHIVTLSSSG